MLVDIFSSFDDHNLVFLSFSWPMWIITLVTMIMFTMTYWTTPSRWQFILNMPKTIISSQIFRSYGKNMGGFINVVASLFIFLIIINLTGLFPYVFSSTSHLAMAFSFALPFWMSLIISGLMKNPLTLMSNLLPTGTPGLLSPFLVLIETVSISVRPITLSVRLMANMGAGHIILGLIGTFTSSGLFIFSMLTTTVLILVQIGYFMFEIGICLIQGYIFSLLVTLYSDDHPNAGSH
uniref:ATP synthase F0 subunit 6 n=1 Tax=Ennucula tenuis TaxID=106224 RepID=UPI00286C5736|nr:ATP synthase F0 subunit 6 [Ennucula tenuis]WLV28179.1 ATP synthase F0 subunit 6 [Ennucula tenuis]